MPREATSSPRGDYGVDPAMVWPFLYGAVRDRKLNGVILGGRISRPLFKSTYNGLERNEPDVGKRVIFLLHWLRQQVGDDHHGLVERAYARAVESARGFPGDRPPPTVLESKARGELLLRVDHARKMAEKTDIPPPPGGWPRGLTKLEFDEEMARQKRHGAQ